MEALTQSRTPSGTFRSRRSHVSLQHISLAPLSSRIPLDDDNDSDYFSMARDGEDSSNTYVYSPHPMTRTYLSSSSVPTTPALLSDSPSNSHTNLSKRKKLGMVNPVSDTNLDSLNIPGPRHHYRSKSSTFGARPKPGNGSERQDTEWMLRAGLAMASTAREEKGQSWLLKRESSTSLISTADQEEERRRNSRRSQKLRSGASTPHVRSRRGSSSHGGSRFGSRAQLAMTPSSPSRRDLDAAAGDGAGLVPDFVDENIRAEIASLQPFADDENRQNSAYAVASRRASAISSTIGAPDSFSSDSETDEEDQFDEVEMQRLTRERGFGLGSWIDRLVEWTLFSVEEEPPSTLPEPSRQSRHIGDIKLQSDVPGAEEDRDSDSDDQASVSDDKTVEASEGRLVEKPSEEGGWSDVGWLFRVAKNAVF